MKNKAVIITMIIVIIILAIIIVCYKVLNKPKQINSIESLKLYYSTGTAIYSSVSYELKCDDECSVKIKKDGEPEEASLTYEVTQDQIDELIRVLNDYNVLSWDGFKKSDNRIMDGNGFSFRLQTKEGLEVDASGYMKYPKDYKEVRDKIISILDKSQEL